ncbi:helix-turn-helix domain-containing protein [Scopulibacillus cellulosilyticus]|uniref:Helix-turn-helix domain-containing protein n=1 Tax=Scopulibacillus cellulosilyticus TaxID=2665665 RepID=A0ABW2PT80_9BACL
MSELGTALKEAREEKGMTLEDIERKTKIQKRYLLAIEEGHFDQLPGNFYSRAFIKNYAEAVGLDPNALFNEYGHVIPNIRQEPSQVVLPPRTQRQSTGLSFKSAKRRQTDSKFNSLLPKIIIVVVLLLILIGIWLLAQHFKSSDKSSATNHTSPDVVYKKDENGSSKNSGAPTQNDQKAKSENKDTKKQAKAKKDKSNQKQHLSLDNTKGNISYYTLTGAKTFNVEISAKPKKQAWIDARDGGPGGKNFAYGMAENNKKFSFDASNASKLYIKAGNTYNTEIKVNGKTLDFPNKSITQTIYITYKKP